MQAEHDFFSLCSIFFQEFLLSLSYKIYGSESFGDDQISYECCFYFIYTVWKGINVL